MQIGPSIIAAKKKKKKKDDDAYYYWVQLPTCVAVSGKLAI